MDKENLNGIPEEETEETNAVEEVVEEITEEAAEETAVQEDIPSDEAEESDEEVIEEITEEAAEETAVQEDIPLDETEESDEEVIEEDSEDFNETEETDSEDYEEEEIICPVCGENPCEENNNYCLECEKKMLKRKIPFAAWLAGLWSLGFSFFAFVIVLLASAPALQVAKGDDFAQKKNWYAAYTEYGKVSDVSAQINEILQKESVYTTAGTGVYKKIVKSVANYSSPIDAYFVAQSLLGVDAPETVYGFTEKYADIYNSYRDTYTAIEDTLNKSFEENPDADKIFAELDTYKGKKGINDVFLYFYKFAISSELGVDYDGQLEILKELEKAALASKEDYGWIYELPMADTLVLAGRYEEATKYIDSMISKDCSKYDAYKLKMDAQLKNGDEKAAAQTLADFKLNNEGFDTAYLLEIMLLRRTCKNDEATTLALDALETYGSEPEINRQLVLTLLVKKDYRNAFDYMMAAYNSAYYQYYYSGDSSTLSNPQFYSTLYLSAYLLNSSDQMTDELKGDVDDILEQFEEGTLTDDANAIVAGEKTVEQILTEGDCDL